MINPKYKQIINSIIFPPETIDNWLDYNSKTKTICWKGVVILTIDMPLEEFIYAKVIVKTFNNINKKMDAVFIYWRKDGL